MPKTTIRVDMRETMPEHFADTRPLNNAQIDALCEEINQKL